MIDTSTEAAAQRSKRGSARQKSLAVAIGVGSLVLGGADAVALVNGVLARDQGAPRPPGLASRQSAITQHQLRSDSRGPRPVGLAY